MQVVWFKKDLRLVDNPAFYEASQNGPILPLYIFEKNLWNQPDASYRHYQYLIACLEDLKQQLHSLGLALLIRQGPAVNVLNEIHQISAIHQLWSCQETGNNASYERDKCVAHWALNHEVVWKQPRQNGVIRRLSDRATWESRWYDWMSQPVLPIPQAQQAIFLKSDTIPTAQDCGVCYDGIKTVLKAGRGAALARLHSFLSSRGQYYTKNMSSPLTAETECSRISADLAFGTLSVRECFQQAQQRLDNIAGYPKEQQFFWRSALQSFMRRLRWHCHFIQKFEDQPEMEYSALHPDFDELWGDHDKHQQWRQAFERGETGFPFIDACMRSLIATGWINFRMRAMLTSFASHHLWLPWQETAQHLARVFVDYEPGIHYPQIQMQSGTTGMNIIRLYNPIKQGMEHDAQAVFIKRWIPELQELSPVEAHQPWLVTHKALSYPGPLVDEKQARTQAASRLYGVKKNWQTTLALVQKHARGKKYQPRNTDKDNS
jgi:deoxyribodipyrimidine photo-lyase